MTQTQTVSAKWELVSKVGYRETLIAEYASKDAAIAGLAQYRAFERQCPGSYPGLSVRQVALIDSAPDNTAQRAEHLAESGGDACDQCGHEDYASHFLSRNGKLYCDDCAEEIGLTEDNTE